MLQSTKKVRTSICQHMQIHQVIYNQFAQNTCTACMYMQMYQGIALLVSRVGDPDVVRQQEGKGEQPGCAQASALLLTPRSIWLSPHTIVASKLLFTCTTNKGTNQLNTPHVDHIYLMTGEITTNTCYLI